MDGSECVKRTQKLHVSAYLKPSSGFNLKEIKYAINNALHI